MWGNPEGLISDKKCSGVTKTRTARNDYGCFQTNSESTSVVRAMRDIK